MRRAAVRPPAAPARVPPYPPRGVRSYDGVVAAAAYVRVSSKSQDDRTQRSAIRRAAAARGDTIARWFAEKASATRNDRPALLELREAARRGELTRLYVFRLDRLSRTGIRDTLGLLHELEGAGCQVVTLADGFTLDPGPARDAIVAVMAWAAQMERAALGERISAARARVEASGKAWGRPRRLDYDRLAKKAWDMRVKEKRTVRAIAMALKIPRSSVADMLSGKPTPSDNSAPREKPGLKKS